MPTYTTLWLVALLVAISACEATPTEAPAAGPSDTEAPKDASTGADATVVKDVATPDDVRPGIDTTATCTRDGDCVGGACELARCVEGACTPVPAPGPCDDGDACTTGDECVAGECRGVARDCDDGNACTDDRCDASGCIYEDDGTCVCDTAEDCSTFDDGDPCNGTLTCEAGACVALAGSPVVCDAGADTTCQQNQSSARLEQRPRLRPGWAHLQRPRGPGGRVQGHRAGVGGARRQG